MTAIGSSNSPLGNVMLRSYPNEIKRPVRAHGLQLRNDVFRIDAAINFAAVWIDPCGLTVESRDIMRQLIFAPNLAGHTVSIFLTGTIELSPRTFCIQPTFTVELRVTSCSPLCC